MNQVRKFRENANKKQEDIAKILNISVPNYSKKENGSLRFSLDEAKTLADFFGVTIDAIFFGEKVSFMETKCFE